MPTWVTRTHPEHDTRVDRHGYVDDLYTGDALRKAREQAEEIAKDEGLTIDDVEAELENNTFNQRPNLGLYLFRRAQGENAQAFDERARLSRFPSQFAHIVDSHVGAVQQAGYEMNRWVDADSGQGPLGDAGDPGTMARQWLHNADGMGTTWHTLLHQGLVALYKNTRLWYLVEGPTERIPQPRVVWLGPESVINWRMEGGRLVEVVVVEERDARTSIRDEHGTQTVHVVYDLDGWQRYDDEGEPIPDDAMEGASGTWDQPFWQTPERDVQILPLGFVDLQLSRDVPLQMARGEEYLFNLLSDIRMALRIAAHPKLHIDADDQAWSSTIKMLLKGANVIRADSADWITLPWDAAQQAREMYKEEVKAYRESSFQQLNDAARERTATEIRQKDQRGRQSWLIHLSRKAEELENAIRYRLAQITASSQPDTWRIPRVTRSTEYQPVDPAAESTTLKDIYFPDGPVPASESTQMEAAKQIGDLQGIPEEDEEGLRAALQPETGRLSRDRIESLRQRVNGEGDSR